MTSSKKKHQPAPAAATGARPAAAKARTPDPVQPAQRTSRSSSTRTWVIRVVATVAIIAGITVTLIGATPGILGGWGKLGLMVPGMILAAGGFIAMIETTPLARSKRR